MGEIPWRDAPLEVQDFHDGVLQDQRIAPAQRRGIPYKRTRLAGKHLSRKGFALALDAERPCRTEAKSAEDKDQVRHGLRMIHEIPFDGLGPGDQPRQGQGRVLTGGLPPLRPRLGRIKPGENPLQDMNFSQGTVKKQRCHDHRCETHSETTPTTIPPVTNVPISGPLSIVSP